jgi:mono/diheme cytochrome c family protein
MGEGMGARKQEPPPRRPRGEARVAAELARRRERSRLVQNLVAIAVASGFVALLVVFWALPDVPRRAPGRASVAAPESAGAGRLVYEEHCAKCHGLRLDGRASAPNPADPTAADGPPLDERGRAWQIPDRVLFDVVRNGGAGYAPPGVTSRMPGFAGRLSDQQIRDALAYVKSRWPDVIRAQQRSAIERGW